MIEVLDNCLVYVTCNEQEVMKKLKRIKEPAATYYRNEVKIAQHWFLDKLTINKLNLRNK